VPGVESADAGHDPLSWEVTLAVLCAAAIHAGWNAMIKRGGDPLFETTLIHAWVAAPAAVAILLLPLPGPQAALCLAGSTAVHCVYYHGLAGAYRSGDLSFAYPIMRGSAPLLTALCAGLLLDEWPAVAGWIGIAAVCAGVLAIGLASAPGADPRARRRSLGWALLTAATIVAYTVIDSIGARSAPSAWSYVAWLAAIEGPVMFAIVLARHGRPLLAHARVRGLAPMGIGIASMGAYAIALWAMTRAPVALVAALRETSVLFALLFASWLLGERVGPLRWAGAASIVVGIVAIRAA
jgi:drug/metabolite transporter (DMT)-like permease